MDRRLILLELNELNFDVVKEYLNLGLSCPNFEKLIASESRITSSESQYDLLEPWIQWPSVHTGKTYEEHNIYRLGDAAFKKPTQIFEVIEDQGLTVGAVSPMNAINRLEQPKYFIPDPWTETKNDGSLLSQMLTSALRQAVNDNAKSRITIKSLLFLGICFVFLVRMKSYFKLFKKALGARKKPWKKALFLDRLLHEMHLTLFLRHRPNFSTVFLNAGAHIQHHYFLNSVSELVADRDNPEWYIAQDEDPFKDMLVEYDEILGDILGLTETEILVATGLTQTPVKRSIFYYRLRDHENFFANLDLPIVKISPRMTRDFLISCDNEADAKVVESTLATITTSDGIQIFGEVDNRGSDLFVVLDYPYEITEDTEILVGNQRIRFIESVVFVAVKNGEHSGRGFAYFSAGLKNYTPADRGHVSGLFSTICKYFGVKEFSA